MKLYSAWYCPFAQRAWMALEHKGIDFDYDEVDPYNKTEWWLGVSRDTAMVPVIVDSDESAKESTVLESNRILEYLDDLYPNKIPIFSGKPSQRAEQKYWIDHISNNITPYFYRYLKANKAGTAQDEALAKMMTGLVSFAGSIHSDGPFFSGIDVGAVDISMIPIAYRIEVLLEHYRNFNLPTEGELWVRYYRWYNAMLETSAFKATATDHDDYRDRLVDFYLPYSAGGGQSDVTVLKSV
ncbi:MAG: glutathione S-transferase N-terminal domain-containing protein [Cocleimonas sp.]